MHNGDTVVAWANLTPCPAILSMLGVFIWGCPAQPTQSALCWSVAIMSILGLFMSGCSRYSVLGNCLVERNQSCGKQVRPTPRVLT